MAENTPAYLRDHVLEADELIFRLTERLAELRGEMGERDRRGIALVKEGGLNVVLTALRAGATLAPHTVDHPATVYVVDGAVTLTLGDDREELEAGQLAAIDAGVSHGLAARTDAGVLITVASA